MPHRELEVAALKAKTSQERPCDDAILLQIGFSQKDLVLGLIWNDTLMGFGVLSMRQVSQNNKNERSQRRTTMQHAMFGDSDCSVESQNKSKTLRRCDPLRTHFLPIRYCIVSLVWDDSLMDFRALGTGQCPRNNKMHDPEEHIVTRNFGNRIAALKAKTRTTLRLGNPLPNHALTERFCLLGLVWTIFPERFGVLGILRPQDPSGTSTHCDNTKHLLLIPPYLHH